MRALFLLEGAPGELESPAATFRVGAYLPFLESAGIQATVRSARPNKYRNGPPRSQRALRAVTFAPYNLIRAARRAKDVIDAAEFDVVFLQRELLPLGPPWIEEMLARRNRRIVFDLDDAIYLRLPFPFGLLTPVNRAEQIARRARVVTAGNRVLADWVRPFCDDVRVLPTGVDTEIFRPRPRSERAKPVVGWIGQPVNLHELESVRAGLREAQRTAPFRLRVITRLPATADLAGLDAEWVAYSHDRHPEMVADLDVAIMPLEDNAWNRGKCGAKLLFAMASGVPVVVSPVGANREIAVDGRTGYHAASAAQWAGRLSRLVSDASRRADMGAAARTWVEDRYSIRTLAPRFVSALHDAAADRRNVASS